MRQALLQVMASVRQMDENMNEDECESALLDEFHNQRDTLEQLAPSHARIDPFVFRNVHI